MTQHELQPSATDFHKCSGCGGEMAFAPEAQALQCNYCGNKQAITLQPLAIKEYDYETAADTANLNWGTTTRLFHCSSCGADTVLDDHASAQSCAFCGSAHVVRHEASAGIAPESLVPFKVTKKTAIENFSKWIKRRFFAPGALKTNYRKQKISGAYIPFWTYDSQTDSSYRAEAGTYYYEDVTRTFTNKDGKTETRTERVRKTRWTPVSGRYSKFFDDELVNASKNMDDRILNRIRPFELKSLAPYSPEFLAGFLAERYSIGLKEGWELAQKSIDKQLHSQITRHINADEVRHLRIDTRFSKIKYKHFLLPVWISAYTFNNKTYQFMINGQTGKVYGKAPVSFWKVLGFIAAILLVIGGLILLFG